MTEIRRANKEVLRAAVGAGLGLLALAPLGVIAGLILLGVVGPPDVECDVQEVGSSLACIPFGFAVFFAPIVLAVAIASLVGVMGGCWVAMTSRQYEGAGKTSVIAGTVAVAMWIVFSWLISAVSEVADEAGTGVHLTSLLVVAMVVYGALPGAISRWLWLRGGTRRRGNVG